MSKTVIKVENLSKQYRLGEIGTGSIAHDINRWWYRTRGKDDPYSRIGDENDRTKKSSSEYVWAVKDINFEIKQGEALGIIGRNGAGKSTLLKILSRTTSPTRGEIKINGRIASLLEVGTGFHPDLTGRENIFLNGAILGMRKEEIKNRFEEIVHFSGIERYIDTPVKRYSSGMYVRLAFAVAAHLEPDILIVDEVLAVGDVEFQRKCLGKMKDVSEKEGMTVIFVSHNMTAISSLCNEVVLMKNGMMKFKGPTQESIKKYLVESLEESKIDLSERSDRTGNGIFRFTEIQFLDGNNREQNVFLSGSEMNIKIKYKLANDEKCKNVVIALGIRNYLDTQITVLSNEYSNYAFETLSPEGAIICKIPKLPLLGGSYSFNLFSKVNGEISDWVLNTCILNIETGDYYNTGRISDNIQSQFLMEYNFCISN